MNSTFFSIFCFYMAYFSTRDSCFSTTGVKMPRRLLDHLALYLQKRSFKRLAVNRMLPTSDPEARLQRVRTKQLRDTRYVSRPLGFLTLYNKDVIKDMKP